jgi:hypothetical protein
LRGFWNMALGLLRKPFGILLRWLAVAVFLLTGSVVSGTGILRHGSAHGLAFEKCQRIFLERYRAARWTVPTPTPNFFAIARQDRPCHNRSMSVMAMLQQLPEFSADLGERI